MRFVEFTTSISEVPGEICIAFTMTGCPVKCNGCHSKYLWDSSNGTILDNDLFESIISKYSNLATCILFMGGEWNESLYVFLDIAHRKGFKTALYTGMNDVSGNLKSRLDYLKTGAWIPSLGGLDSPTTNQKLVRLKDGQIMNQLFRRQA